jgi:hypothetical protein
MNEKQNNLNLNIATNLELRTKRMKKASLQQCIKNISGSVVYEAFEHLISSAKSAI